VIEHLSSKYRTKFNSQCLQKQKQNKTKERMAKGIRSSQKVLLRRWRHAGSCEKNVTGRHRACRACAKALQRSTAIRRCRKVHASGIKWAKGKSRKGGLKGNGLWVRSEPCPPSLDTSAFVYSERNRKPLRAECQGLTDVFKASLGCCVEIQQ
jgi:hypothetical protein